AIGAGKSDETTAGLSLRRPGWLMAFARRVRDSMPILLRGDALEAGAARNPGDAPTRLAVPSAAHWLSATARDVGLILVLLGYHAILTGRTLQASDSPARRDGRKVLLVPVRLVARVRRGRTGDDRKD